MFRQTLKTAALTTCLTLAWSASALANLTVRVIAPDKTVWDSEAQEVILPSTTGQLGILTDHAPMLTALDNGVMCVRPQKDWVSIALMGGFAQIENNEVTILVNGAELGDSIDREAARIAYIDAEERLERAEAGDNLEEKVQAMSALKQARTRFAASQGDCSGF